MSESTISAPGAAQACAARWLSAWDAQGAHRTATPGDTAGAEWLAREAAALGAEVSVEEFALDRLDPVAAYLEIERQRIEAEPAFDAPATGPEGIAGRLGRDIAFAELSPRAVYSGEFERARRQGGDRALVILCAGEAPGMALLNAERFRRPYGAPAIHVASEARGAVLAAAGRGAPARLVSHSRRTPATARNIVAALPGSRRDRPPLVIMTPRSSWWQSTAERGGGLVCWLESLRALIAMPPARPVVFTANSGHELGHLGLDDFLARRPGWDRPADAGGAVWLHYGANIGAAGGALSLMSNGEDLRGLAESELIRAGQPPYSIAPKTTVPSGETRDIHLAGGRYLTFIGSNPLFHLPQDRWPHAVDLAVVIRAAAAAAGIAVALTR
jgi:hypothetical protein